MNNQQKLIAIKVIHTVIWLFFVVIIFYILFCGIFDRITLYTWVAIGLVLMEGLVLVVLQQHCPLTLQARKYSDSDKDNFDIYLPINVAKYNKEIFTLIYVVGLVLVFYKVLK